MRSVAMMGSCDVDVDALKTTTGVNEANGDCFQCDQS